MFNLFKRIYGFITRLCSYEFWHLNYIIGKKIKDHCIMITPWSSGDTLLILANIELIEKETGVKIFPVVRKSHAVILELCQYKKDFLLIDIINDLTKFYGLPCIKKAYHCLFGAQIREKMKPVIKAGNLYVAHPDFYLETRMLGIKYTVNVPEMFQRYFKSRTLLKFPASVCKIKSTANIITDPKHTIMLCPHAATVKELPQDFWYDLSIALKSMKWYLCYNAVEPLNYLPPDVIWLDCSFRDVIATGQEVAFVISLRSGICDLLANIGERLIAIYPDITYENGHSCLDAFDLNKYFSRNDIGSCIYKEKNQAIAFIMNYIS